MRRSRKVKILATIGPASSSEEMLKKLFEAGADVFRINMSHTDHEMMRTLVGRIRAVEEAVGRPIGILADLQGPKLRVGKFANGKETLSVGQTFTLDDNPEPGTSTRVYLPHPEILSSVEAGHRLLIDDGKLELRAVKSDGKAIVCTVVAGTTISDKKGVSLPDTDLPVGALTEKDRKDLDAVLATGVDWVALSFVQRPEDLAEARKIARGRALIMAKIEKPQAVARLAEIIELSDALMVARGDLGVEMPLEAVPGIQKQITRAARRAGKPVVVATQMLESMITAPVPTRAEVSDVSIAVFEGADAIMLSAESAAGAYPVEAVAMMNRIATKVETDPTYAGIINAQRSEPEATGADAISLAAREIADHHLHGVRHDRTARRARASSGADYCAVADPQHGAAAVASVGHALRRLTRRQRPRRHGRPGLPHRLRGRLRQAGRPRHHHRRRAVAHARVDQHAAHRLCRLGRAGQPHSLTEMRWDC
jgi:pyruvate kinase